MKIRNGFVSNSSSSSFCIIGIDGCLVSKLSKAEGLNFPETGYQETEMVRGCNHNIKNGKSNFCSKCGKPIWIEKYKEVEYDMLSYGHCKGKTLEFYGRDYPVYCGMDAEGLLQDKNLVEAKEYFCLLIKEKYDIDICVDNVKLLYGEMSSE